MTLFQWIHYIVLGLIQGLSEILPISSSGHLALFQYFFQFPEANFLTFTLLLHLGSFIALIIYFFPLLSRLALSFFAFAFNGFRLDSTPSHQVHDVQLILWIGLATVPAALAGLFFRSVIETIFSELWIVGLGFLMTSSFMFVLSRFQETPPSTIGFKQALLPGLFQVLGIFPGVSRSGMTILGGQISGVNLKQAKEFSFLMFLPITFGAFLVDVLTINETLIFISLDHTVATIVASIIAGVSTYIALHIFLKRLTTRHFIYFAWYLMVLGTFTILLTIFQ
jgi:undecaprenyl-diphosphatase